MSLIEACNDGTCDRLQNLLESSDVDGFDNEYCCRIFDNIFWLSPGNTLPKKINLVVAHFNDNGCSEKIKSALKGSDPAHALVYRFAENYSTKKEYHPNVEEVVNIIEELKPYGLQSSPIALQMIQQSKSVCSSNEAYTHALQQIEDAIKK